VIGGEDSEDAGEVGDGGGVHVGDGEARAEIGRVRDGGRTRATGARGEVYSRDGWYVH
jgi:hypothetical protein